jgi:hypothetical protein
MKTFTTDELRVAATRYKYNGILVLNEDLECILDFIQWLDQSLEHKGEQE